MPVQPRLAGSPPLCHDRVNSLCLWVLASAGNYAATRNIAGWCVIKRARKEVYVPNQFTRLNSEHHLPQGGRAEWRWVDGVKTNFPLFFQFSLQEKLVAPLIATHVVD